MSGFDRRRRRGRTRDAQNIAYAKFEEEQKILNQQRITSNIDSNIGSGRTDLKQTPPQVAASTKSSTTETSSTPTLPGNKDSDLNRNYNHKHKRRRSLSDIDDCVDNKGKKDDRSSKNKRKTLSFVDEKFSINKNTRTSPSSLSTSRRLDDVPDRVMDWNLEDDFHISRKVTQDRKLPLSSSSLSSKKNDSGKGSVPTISKTTTELSPIKKVGNNQSNSYDIDDDDDEDDFFQLMPVFQASKKNKNEDKSNVSTKKAAPLQEVPPPRANGIRTTKRGSSIDFSDNEDRVEKKDNDSSSSSRKEIESHRDETKHNHNKMTRKRNHGGDDNNIDDDRNDDDDDGDSIRTKENNDSSCGGKKKSKSDVKKNRKNTHHSSSDSSDDKESDSEDDKKKSPKRPRNPITYAKEQDDLLSKMNHRQKVASYNNNNDDGDGDGDDDGFMDDCKYIESQSPDKPKKKASQSKKKRSSDHPNAASYDDDDDDDDDNDDIVDDDIESPDKTKKKTSQSKKKRSSDSSRNSGLKKSHIAEDDDPTSDGEETQPRDTGIGLEDLHPDFDDPKFGPYEMEPLLLTTDQTEEGQVLQVPASLNRYLIPFQKEGVKFLYECLSRKSGAILGDEMGCGKTIQIIGLLCALFNKTGTKKDLQDIRDRNRLVSEHISKLQKLKYQALCNGEIVEENIEEWKETLSISPWHPVMIVVPPTILEVWNRAFQDFSHFSVSMYSGKSPKRTDAIKSVFYGNADILLVPKSAFQSESNYRDLEKVKWKLVIIDEFHNFKNYKAKLSIHLRQLKELHQPLVIGMTGTTMQNNYTELWNVVDLAQTNYLGTLEDFKRDVDRPLLRGRQKGANPDAKNKSEVIGVHLRDMLNKMMIVRTKQEVFPGDQIPQKTERVIFCDLSPLQKEVYMHVLELPEFDLVKHGSRPCDCGINQDFFRQFRKLSCKAEQLEYYRRNKSLIKNQSQCCKGLPINPRYGLEGGEGEPYIDQDATIWRSLKAHSGDDAAATEGCENCPYCCTFPCLQKLKSLSSHLGLIQAPRQTTEAQVKGSPAYINYIKAREFAKVSLSSVASRLPGRGYERSESIMDDHFSLSGKLRVLARLLEKYYNESAKVLLFAHSTQTLDLIENWLRSRQSFVHLRMDGSTPTRLRQGIADDFNGDPHIFLFLLSTKAMGQGLTLNSANRVILFDIDWNPSWEIQAQDRAHRIGQTRDVEVVRLISNGTIEEMIYLRQIYKMHLKQDALEDKKNDDCHEAPRVFRGVQGDKHMKGELFGTENLFRFKENGGFLDDIWAQPKTGRKDDSSGLKFHESAKLTEMLLKVGDDDIQKSDENEEITKIQAMSGKVDSPDKPEKVGKIKRKYNPLDTDESDSDDEISANEEPLEGKVRAVNHGDLLRSDKGGAAIMDGEDGFDEEMGGCTQAAYAIYENVKDVLGDDEEDEDDNNNNNNDDDTSNQQDIPIVSVKSEFNKDKAKSSTVATPVDTIDTKPTSESMTKTENTPTHDTTKTNALKSAPENNVERDYAAKTNEPKTTPENNIERDYAAKTNEPKTTPENNIEKDCATKTSEPKTTSENNIEKECATKTNEPKTKTIINIDEDQVAKSNASTSANVIMSVTKTDAPKRKPVNNIKNGNQTKRKILLMGLHDVDNAPTEFDKSDFAIPAYGKKKKKKKKKKGKKGV